MSTTLLRLAAATALVGAIVVSVAPHATSYVSLSAVVNAPLVPVTAPFSGTLEEPSKAVSRPVTEGDRLLVLRDVLGEDSELRALEGTLRETQADGKSLIRQEKDLLELKATLEKRQTARISSRMDWFDASIDEARADVVKSEAEVAAAEERLQRVSELSKRGATTSTEVLGAETELLKAKAEVARKQAVVRRLGVERTALEGDSAVDLTYSGMEQIEYRLDEIAVRLADINARKARHAARVTSIYSQIDDWSEEVERRRTFEPQIAATGLVWEASGRANTSVAAGETIASVLDCTHRFVEVVLPERHFENIAPGSDALVQLKGSRETFRAKVLATYGSAARPNRAMQAASPRIEIPEGLRIIVGLGAADVTKEEVARSFCDVGRTAEVRFALADDSITSRLMHALSGSFSALQRKVAALPSLLAG